MFATVEQRSFFVRLTPYLLTESCCAANWRSVPGPCSAASLRRRDDPKVEIAKDDTRVSCDAHETPAQPLSGYPLDIDVARVYAEFDTLLSSALRPSKLAHSPGISNRHLVPSAAKESSTSPPSSKGNKLANYTRSVARRA
jgi:hypothetical protein